VLSASQKRARQKAERRDRERRHAAKMQTEFSRWFDAAAIAIPAHEAGHAITALTLGLSVNYAKLDSTIVPHTRGGRYAGRRAMLSGGHIGIDQLKDFWTLDRRVVARLLTVTVAGHVAESMVATSVVTRLLVSEQIPKGGTVAIGDVARRIRFVAPDDLAQAKECCSLLVGCQPTAEVQTELITDAEQDARRILQANLDAWNRLREALGAAGGRLLLAAEVTVAAGRLILPDGLNLHKIQARAA
jgi:hypothetical protein